MKNISFRNKIITKLLGAVAISFFISFGLTILILVYVIDPLFVKHEEFGMFEGNLALFFLFAFA
ncbi:two-component sensor histidine kinase, partial [Bacillus thuringiensis]